MTPTYIPEVAPSVDGFFMPERGSMSTYDKLVGATALGELPPAVLAGIEASVAEYTPTASRATVDYWISPTGDDTAEGSNTASTA